MSLERKNDLILAAKDLVQVWHDWREDNEVWHITEEFTDALVRCLSLFKTGDIPSELRALSEEMGKLLVQWNILAGMLDANEANKVVPKRKFWAALEAVERTLEAATIVKKSYPSPAYQLAKDAGLNGMTEAQLCRMYGFTNDGTRNGICDHSMLHEALEDPKKYFDAHQEWMWPGQRQQLANEERQREMADEVKRRWERKKNAQPRVAQESIEELLQMPGMSGKQICRMKRITQEELEEYCAEHVLPIPSFEPTGIGIGVSEEETPLKPVKALESELVKTNAVYRELLTEIGGPLTLEQQIIELRKLDASLSPGQIAGILSTEETPVTAVKVGKVLSRWERDPAAFETASP